MSTNTYESLKLKGCSKDTPALQSIEVLPMLQTLPEWTLYSETGVLQLQRSYAFGNFMQALAFTNLLGELSEASNHHPSLLTQWGKVTVQWWTHTINGLHENDIIMAQRCDEAYASYETEA